MAGTFTKSLTTTPLDYKILSKAKLHQVLVGSWDLTSFTVADQQWRGGARGLLIYSSDGHMAVSINGKDDSRDWPDNCLFYSGMYSVSDGQVTHNVTLATGKARLEKKEVRKAEYDEANKLLRLSADTNYGKAVLVWKKNS